METISTTLLQIFFKFNFHFKVILKSIAGPDETLQLYLQA